MEITLCSRAPPLMNLISLHYPSLHSVSLTQNNTPSALFSPLWRKLVGEKKRRERRSLFSVSFQVQWASHPAVYFISALSHSRGGVYPPWLHVHGNKSEFCLSTQWGKMQWNVHVHSNKKSFLKKFFFKPNILMQCSSHTAWYEKSHRNAWRWGCIKLRSKKRNLIFLWADVVLTNIECARFTH